jgi:hypothetical protein
MRYLALFLGFLPMAACYQPLCGANYRSPLFHALLSRRYGAPADHAHADRGFRCAKDIP